jgi:hypothetical protein
LQDQLHAGRIFHLATVIDSLLWHKDNHRARIGGKTAQQLAQMAQQPELVKIMDELQSKEKRIALVYCRCGSRLPWKECHAGDSVGESPVYSHTEDEGRLAWRCSPLARCPCQHSKKTQYKCCWKHSCIPYYLDDSNGSTLHSINNLVDLLYVSGAAMEVMGITDRIMNYLEGDVFEWTGRDWWVPKAELLVMMKRWNIALEKYCDDAGMTGSHRASVIEENCATPYAPCGNVRCTNIETKVKAFSKCSKCKTIAYCSSECQKKGWKAHKGSCRFT